MKKVLVASHGHLASGIRSSIGILTGMADMVEAVDCYVDDSDFIPRIQAFIDSVGPEDEAIIFTDIYGGSVFQKVVLMEPEKRGIVHVTGMNLGLVIETLLGHGRFDQAERRTGEGDDAGRRASEQGRGQRGVRGRLL
jgi:mannose/fructose-specific phosphotransferase system component IIA